MFPGDHLTGKKRDEAFAKWAAEEAARIVAQRKVLTAQAGRTRSGQKLIRQMLDRAWWFLDAGECEAADALLEFVPEDQATALLDEFFKENGA